MVSDTQIEKPCIIFDPVVVMAMVYTIGCDDIVFLIGQLIKRKITSSGEGEGGRRDFDNV